MLGRIRRNMKCTILSLVLLAAACGSEPAVTESPLDYHVLSIYSQYLESLTHDNLYSADAIAAALAQHPIHYHMHPEGWKFTLKNPWPNGANEADGVSWPQPDGSWHVECVPSAFAHEVAHYLQSTVGGFSDPYHTRAEWWGVNGVVDSVVEIARETR